MMMADYEDPTARINDGQITATTSILQEMSMGLFKVSSDQQQQRQQKQQNYQFGALSDVEVSTAKTIANKLESPIILEKTPTSPQVKENTATTTKTTLDMFHQQMSSTNTAFKDLINDEGRHTSDDDDDDDDDEEDHLGEEEEEYDGGGGGNSSHEDDLHHNAREGDTDSDTDSDFSDLSGLSDVSGKEWKPRNARPINWVQKQIHSGVNPRELLSQILPNANSLAPDLSDTTLWRLVASILSEPPRRHKLQHINTFEDVIDLLKKSKNIMVLTGAGVSVSCGIPDFRSSDGIYSRLAKDYPNLPDPQAMFDISFFSRDPRPFFKFAREIYPGQFRPSPCHRFIKMLERKQKLLRNYTQNIDTLEEVAGIQNVIECHGSFSTASCTKCRYQCNADAIRADIFAQHIPVCPKCQPDVRKSVDASEPVAEAELVQLVENGIMKPDIVFFGEGLPEKFHTVMASDKDKCDLLIVMGSSLKVRPVALIPSSLPAHVPQILINREQLHHLEFDVELLGDSDVIINQICHRLGEEFKEEICFDEKILKESKELLPLEEEVKPDLLMMPNGDPIGGGGGVVSGLPPLMDTDTQSVKSNASDLALQSAGTYSDSGFESSTSSGGNVMSAMGGIPLPSSSAVVTSSITDGEENVTEAINKIKTSILEFSGERDLVLPTISTEPNLAAVEVPDFLPPELLENQSDAAVDFNTPPGNVMDFHPFMPPDEGVGYRQLMGVVDSSKDSGIQCDSSSVASMVMPPLQSPSSNDELVTMPEVPTTSSAAVAAVSLTAMSEVKKTNCNDSKPSNSVAPSSSLISESGCSASANSSTLQKRRSQRKRKSAADRLQEGTYYCHENTSSYVFPGAQVSWTLDFEAEEDEAEDEDEADLEDDEEDEEDEEIQCYDGDNDNDDIEDNDRRLALSPLMAPSLEAEMVNEINMSNAGGGLRERPAMAKASATLKRSSTEAGERPLTASPMPSTEASDASLPTSTSDGKITESPPALKRRRCSTILSRGEQEATQTQEASTTASPIDSSLTTTAT